MKVRVDSVWAGEDIFLIGGGASLSGFDFQLLKGRRVIGVNEAFTLGVDIVPVVIFGDGGWFHRRRSDLTQYHKSGGWIFSISTSLEKQDVPMLRQVRRVTTGLFSGDALGWNSSTGAAAINLAISMGGRNIFLLGYDLTKDKEGESHWHSNYPHITRESSFNNFARGFADVHRSLKKFPFVRVINVTDGSSRLPLFERLCFEGLKERLHGTGKENAEAEGRLVGSQRD